MTPAQQQATVALYLRLSPRLKARLRDYASRQDVSMNDVICLAVEDFLEKHDPTEMQPPGAGK